MTKTKFQEAAMRYAEDYLERILKMEDMVGHNVVKKIKRLAEREVKQSDKKKKGK